MKTDSLFLKQNRFVFLGILFGLIAGYMYWLHCGIYDGTSAFSSECWTNCVYGILFGGLSGCLIKKD